LRIQPLRLGKAFERIESEEPDALDAEALRQCLRLPEAVALEQSELAIDRRGVEAVQLLRLAEYLLEALVEPRARGLEPMDAAVVEVARDGVQARRLQEADDAPAQHAAGQRSTGGGFHGSP
jgi:hypothetical protein